MDFVIHASTPEGIRAEFIRWAERRAQSADICSRTKATLRDRHAAAAERDAYLSASEFWRAVKIEAVPTHGVTLATTHIPAAGGTV
jgi:hypothetical protein